MARINAAVRVQLEGDKEMRAKLVRAISDQGVRKEARGATKEVGQEILDVTEERCPVKTGKLVGSARLLVMVSPKKEDIRISLVYGGPGIPYARIVHETHKTHSKFLEGPLREAVPTAGQRIADKIDLKRAAGV